ncbi:MAG: DUF3800 domain-containing protein [Akkermansiaceae bacterium]|nr:DUF3800 domain-containing protein [Akkermansiaceae bacterium]
MHWCFIDESWRDGVDEKIGVLAATVGPARDFQKLDAKMYQVRKKYLGEDHAKDRTSELKGTQLLSNNSFKMLDQHGFSKNLCVVREILEFVKTTQIRYIGVTVYGNKKPSLLAPHARDLARPFKELCYKLEAAIPRGQAGIIVFDQRVGAQEGISVAISNYLSGIPGRKKLHPDPLVGVSNVHAGLQLADIAAFILGKRAAQDKRIEPFYRILSASKLETTNSQGKTIYGFVRFQQHEDGRFTIRKHR